MNATSTDFGFNVDTSMRSKPTSAVLLIARAASSWLQPFSHTKACTPSLFIVISRFAALHTNTIATQSIAFSLFDRTR